MRGRTAGAPRRGGRFGRALLSVAVLASATVVWLPGPAAQAAPSTTFHTHTEYKTPTGAIITTDVDALVGSPAFIDVDHNPATGSLGKDIKVQLSFGDGVWAGVGVPNLVVARTSGVEAVFPLLVKVSLDANTTTYKTVTLGYDSLADTAPAQWSAFLRSCNVVQGTCATPMVLEFFTTSWAHQSPVKTLGVIGEVLRTDGSRLQARVDLTPPPDRVQISSSPTDVSYTAWDDNGQYWAAQVVPEVKVDIYDSAGLFGRAKYLSAVLQQVPADLALAYDASTGAATLDAKGGTLGLGQVLLSSLPPSQVGSADRLDEVCAPATCDGVLLRDMSDRYVLEARVAGLRKAIYNPQGPSATLDTTDGRAFKLDTLSSTTSTTTGAYTRAAVDKLPTSVSVALGSGTLTYSASSVVGQITFDAYNPRGLFGQAKYLSVDLRQVPTALAFSFNSSTGAVSGDAKGGTLGYVKATATSVDPSQVKWPDWVNGHRVRDAEKTCTWVEPWPGLPGYWRCRYEYHWENWTESQSVGGVVRWDNPQTYAIFARFHDLRGFAYNPSGPSGTLKEDGSPFTYFDVNSGGEYLQASLDRRPVGSSCDPYAVHVPSCVGPKDISLSVSKPSGSAFVVDYSASGAGTGLYANTNAAGSPMQVSLTNPLPATFSVCKASDASCSNHVGSYYGDDSLGSIKFSASQHTNLSYAESGVTKANLWLRYLELDMAYTVDIPECTASDARDGNRCAHGAIWMDTTPPGYGSSYGALTGTANLAGYSQRFPSGFWAHDRFGWFEVYANFSDDNIDFRTGGSGSASCPAGTTLGEPQKVEGYNYRFMTSALCGSLGSWN
ncbi:MAG: hypothetical protein HY775_04350 [Acidobacteria bacterium]|nr:hypothetical protein [Acidobacteriota bacterium]